MPTNQPTTPANAQPTTRPSRKEQTHDRILDAAARALRRKGFSGVGVAEVMKEAGLTHGGFYAHFESRDAMLAEALERAGRDSAIAINQAIAAQQARGASAFRAFVDSYLHDNNLAAPSGGCPVAALASDFARCVQANASDAGDADDVGGHGANKNAGVGASAAGTPNHDAAAERVRAAARQRVARLVAGVHNTLPAGTAPGAATVVASTLVGTLQLARTLGNNAQGRALLAASRQALVAQYDTAPGGGAPDAAR